MPETEKSTRPMKMKMMLMLAVAVGAPLLHAGDLHVYLTKRQTSPQQRTAQTATAAGRAYEASIEQFNQAWPFGQQSNQD